MKAGQPIEIVQGRELANMELIETSAERHAVLSAPVRRPFSIRRTSSVELSWPEGHSGPFNLEGRGRDLVTLEEADEHRTLMEDRVEAFIGADRVLRQFGSEPPLPEHMDLVGQHAMKGFRKAIAPLFVDPAYARRPLVQLLDDFVGTGVISVWIYAKWAQAPSGFDRRGNTDACIGYAEGSGAFDDQSQLHRSHIVPLPEGGGDPHAYHDLGPLTEATVRRLRRIDVWREEDLLMIDAMFADSGVLHSPTHRSAIHEYRLQASADRHDGDWRLASIAAQPGTLPYTECHAAPLNLQRLVGTPLADLRPIVLGELRGPLGCTHLNDAARSLAEAGVLAEKLEAVIA